MKLTFWGATQQVTGSMYMLEVDDYRILIDCGLNFDLDEKQKKVLYDKQKSVFPFDPTLVNTVLLTHAHIDHSGNIPNLYKEGFEGQVVCTDATYSLTGILLENSAMLHQKRLNTANGKASNKKKKSSLVKDFPRDLYLQKHVKQALESFFPVSFGQRYRISDRVNVTFIPAGHLLGAAHIVVEVQDVDGEKKSLCFSGDVGRKSYPLLVDPQPVPQVDYLICETTYGNRVHEDMRPPGEALMDVIQRTCVDIPGRLIIPTFSVGRTQALLYTLNKLYLDRQLPPLKVFTDSPLSFGSTRIHQKYARLLNQEAREFKEQNEMLFDFENLVYIESGDASKAISNYAEPCVIISSSGMVQGGRIEHHIAANIENPYATVLMIGYASEGTLGWRLLNGQDSITIDGKQKKVLANIEKIDVFSGHGDRDDLIDFVKNQDSSQLKNIFLIHGEAQSMRDFRDTLAVKGYEKVVIPEKGQAFEL